MECNESCQHLQKGSTRRRGEEWAELFEEIRAENSNLLQHLNLYIQEAQQILMGETQRDSQQETLYIQTI